MKHEVLGVQCKVDWCLFTLFSSDSLFNWSTPQFNGVRDTMWHSYQDIEIGCPNASVAIVKHFIASAYRNPPQLIEGCAQFITSKNPGDLLQVAFHISSSIIGVHQKLGAKPPVPAPPTGC